MWSLIIVVFDEFPVELESSMLKVVCSEPAFDLALRCGFADASEDMFDLLLLAVGVERGLASADAPELAAVIGEDLSWLRVFVDGSVEEPDDVLGGAFVEAFAAGHVAAVIVEDTHQPSWRIKLQIALPQAVGTHPLPTPICSFDSGLGYGMVEAGGEKGSVHGHMPYWTVLCS